MGRQSDHSCGLSKDVLSRDRVKSGYFGTFDIIISHVFPENFFVIRQVSQKIWRFSPSIWTIFIGFLDFLTFAYCKETSDVRI